MYAKSVSDALKLKHESEKITDVGKTSVQTANNGA